MEEWAFKYAHQWDEKAEGKYAYLGMLKIVEEHFNLGKDESDVTEYVLETYLECYDENDDVSFEEYLNHCRIWTEHDLKNQFNDIWSHCMTYEGFCEYMGYFYPEDTEYMFPWEDGVFTTWIDKDFEKNRKEINWTGVMMECERLLCMMDYEDKYGIEITESELNKVIEIIAEYGYDIREDYEYETAFDVLDRYNQVFGGIM